MGAHATISATKDEWHGDAIALLEFGNSDTHLDDDAANLMPGNEWQSVCHNVAIVALPTVPVGSAYARGHYLDDDTVRRGGRSWY
mmetsp:Transcript_27677/g.50946  ORF Transcript_27677/g.50946 Transcript_27677/m.50946 type:complete len:85 (-) Transcript_27677:55-309(-)